MNVINATFSKWNEIEASLLEKYKHKYEGLGRTPGSYILTNVKAISALDEADPNMATVKNCINLIPITGASLVVAGITFITVRNHYKKKATEVAEKKEKESN